MKDSVLTIFPDLKTMREQVGLKFGDILMTDETKTLADYGVRTNLPVEYKLEVIII